MSNSANGILLLGNPELLFFMDYKDNNKNKDYKYILYARKSTESEDRQVASIDSQISEMTKLAEQFDLNITHVMSEASSGFKVGRQVFNQMLELIQKGEADGIICWKLSRLSRNPDDAGRIMGMLQRGEIKHIRTNSRDWYPQDNVMMMYVEFGITNQFSVDLREDTARGMRRKAERGWKPTARLPLGYIHNMQGKDKKAGRLPEEEILCDPDRFELVKLGLGLVASRAMSPAKALEHVNELGLRTRNGKEVSSGTFYNLMANEFYYGEFEHPQGSGNWYEGKHHPAITKEQYDSIQSQIGNKSTARPHTYFFSYTGLMTCGECGCFITAEKKTKLIKSTGEYKSYVYYRCTKSKGHCNQKTLELDKLEKQFKAILKNIYIPPEFADWAIEELKKEHEKEKQSRGISTKINNKNYDDCLKKIDKLVESYLNGDTPRAIYKSKLKELEKEKKTIKKMIDHTDERVDEWLRKAEDILNFAKNAKYEFENGTLAKKKAIVAYLGSDLFLTDRKVTISIQKPIDVLKKYAYEANTLADTLEPLELVGNTVKYRGELDSNSIWGG